MMASFSAHSFDRDVRKVRNFNPAKKTKFKRLKKFDLKKV